jgi:hypothetical protein
LQDSVRAGFDKLSGKSEEVQDQARGSARDTKKTVESKSKEVRNLRNLERDCDL